MVLRPPYAAERSAPADASVSGSRLEVWFFVLCRHPFSLLTGTALWDSLPDLLICSQAYQPTMLRATSPRSAGVT